MENKYIAQANKGKTDAWRYVVGIVFAIVGCGLFSLPHSWAIRKKISLEEVDSLRLDDIAYVFSLFDNNTTLVYIMLPFMGGLLALCFTVYKLHHLSWIHLTTSRNQVDFKRILFSFSVWGSISAIIILLGVFVSSETLVLNFKAEKFAILFIIAIVLVPIQTSFEEYVFRGYLMQGLGLVSKTNWFPLLITSVTFGLMHLGNPEVGKLGYGIMVFYIGTGLLLGIITLMDEGMELSLGFHAANNLVTALLVTTDWTAFQTHAVFKDFSTPNLLAELSVMAVLYPLLLLLFAKKYNWKNWKEKLI